MREILFKAKRVDNGCWIEGFYTDLFDEERQTNIPTIVFQSFESASMDYPYPSCNTVWAEVDPKTVCQFTGLKDKNGKKIFEGDKVECNDVTYELIHNAGMAYELHNKEYGQEFFLFNHNDIVEITGNIHDK